MHTLTYIPNLVQYITLFVVRSLQYMVYHIVIDIFLLLLSMVQSQIDRQTFYPTNQY